MAEIFYDIETNGLFNKVDEKFITCIGLYHSDLGIRVFSSKNESKMLTDFFAFIEAEVSSKDIWVSFNGISFDVPFICRRAEILELEIPDIFSKPLDNGWILNNHVDLMKVIYPNYAETVRATSTGRMTKDSARGFFNIYEPRAGSAQHCLLCALGDEWSPIFMHNAMDLFTTKELYDKCVKRKWC